MGEENRSLLEEEIKAEIKRSNPEVRSIPQQWIA